mgnify:CR=1 FL=1
MPFQKGNKLGAKGRPVGSKNKTTIEKNISLQYCNIAMGACSKSAKVLKTAKFDVRMKAMSFFYSRPAVDMNIDTKPPYADVKFITDVGEEDLTEDQKKELYYKHGGDGTNPIDLPLFLD